MTAHNPGKNVIFNDLTPKSLGISRNPIIRSFSKSHNGQTMENWGASARNSAAGGPSEGSEKTLQPLQTGAGLPPELWLEAALPLRLSFLRG